MPAGRSAPSPLPPRKPRPHRHDRCPAPRLGSRRSRVPRPRQPGHRRRLPTAASDNDLASRSNHAHGPLATVPHGGRVLDDYRKGHRPGGSARIRRSRPLPRGRHHASPNRPAHGNGLNEPLSRCMVSGATPPVLGELDRAAPSKPKATSSSTGSSRNRTPPRNSKRCSLSLLARRPRLHRDARLPDRGRGGTRRPAMGQRRHPCLARASASLPWAATRRAWTGWRQPSRGRAGLPRCPQLPDDPLGRPDPVVAGRADHVATFEHNLHTKVLKPDFCYLESDGRWTAALLCALTGRPDEARRWFRGHMTGSRTGSDPAPPARLLRRSPHGDPRRNERRSPPRTPPARRGPTMDRPDRSAELRPRIADLTAQLGARS